MGSECSVAQSFRQTLDAVEYEGAVYHPIMVMRTSNVSSPGALESACISSDTGSQGGELLTQRPTMSPLHEPESLTQDRAGCDND